jgi:hypothetical protein
MLKVDNIRRDTALHCKLVVKSAICGSVSASYTWEASRDFNGIGSASQLQQHHRKRRLPNLLPQIRRRALLLRTTTSIRRDPIGIGFASWWLLDTSPPHASTLGSKMSSKLIMEIMKTGFHVSPDVQTNYKR